MMRPLLKGTTLLLAGVLLCHSLSFAQTANGATAQTTDAATSGAATGQTAQSGASSDPSSTTDKILNLPSKFLSRIQDKTASLDQQLTQQTEKYLRKMQRREDKLKKKLYKVDSTATKRLFANSAQQYAALEQKIAHDTGSAKPLPVSGEYQPYTDSLKGTLSFLQRNPQLLSDATAASPQSAALQSSIAQLQQVQAKMQDADQARAFIQQRKQEIGNYISQHTNLRNLLGPQFQGMDQDAYYYTQRLQQFKATLNNPDELEKQALSALDQLPAFQQFMKNNSQLASLFNLPGNAANAGNPLALSGLQTRSQVQQMLQGQLAAGGPGAMNAMQQGIQSAQSQLDQYKDKLTRLGAGGPDVDQPGFKPNNQKTRTFLQRLEYGLDMQTTQTSGYFPTTTALGLSLGYKLNNSNSVGVGASYKIGYGSDFHHIVLSNQGAGLRSYIDINIKGSFSASGGLEYNYTLLNSSLQQMHDWNNWTPSGLVGLTKTVSVKSRALKKTRLQLLWDFLSYQQVPRTQPILFRVGYVFN